VEGEEEVVEDLEMVEDLEGVEGEGVEVGLGPGLALL